MERTNDKASILINGGSITGDPSRYDFIFLCLARNYTDGQSNLMRELFLMTPLNRIKDTSKRPIDIKYLEYLDKSINKVLSLGRYITFNWNKHYSYKRRLESYERN